MLSTLAVSTVPAACASARCLRAPATALLRAASSAARSQATLEARPLISNRFLSTATRPTTRPTPNPARWTPVRGVASSAPKPPTPKPKSSRRFWIVLSTAAGIGAVAYYNMTQNLVLMDTKCAHCEPSTKPQVVKESGVKVKLAKKDKEGKPPCCADDDKPPAISIFPAGLGAESVDLIYEAVEGESLELSKLPVEEAMLMAAPNVPPPITRDHPALVKVPLVTTTKIAQLTNQYKYEQWTFNDTVPGPFIRARVGDVMELELTNKDTTGNPHNIDSHAFTGPGGGAAVTTAKEGETKTARFKLLCPGLYVYHCAAAPVPVHIANGMYGMLYVQPEKDLPKVDKEYYVMQSEFYHEPPETDDDGRRSDLVEFSYPNGLREEPNVVVFNGSESALTRKPLKAATGETVRLFFGNAGPNLTSAFHVIGSHFRSVYRDGDVISPPGKYVQTVSVPPGGASIVDMKMVVPGTYALVDHAIFRMDKGGVGFLNVTGKPRDDVYQSQEPQAPCTGCKLHS